MSERFKTLFFALAEDRSTAGELSQLPLHVSITPAFYVENRRLPLLQKHLTQQISDRKPFRITGTEDAMFGENQDIKVRKVGGSVLWLLHDSMLKIVRRQDSAFDMKFAGENYQPHVTYIGNRGLREGQIVEVQELLLAQKGFNPDEPANWNIVGRIDLEEPDYDIRTQFL